MPDTDPCQLNENENGQPADTDPSASRAAEIGILATMCLAAEGVLHPITEHLPMPVRLLAHGTILGGYALAAYATVMD